MADVLIARGELDAAVALLRGAAAALAPTGYSWGPLAWMLLAQALGQQGVDRWRRERRCPARNPGTGSSRCCSRRSWRWRGRGRWHARRDEHGAIAAAREAARTAERGGQSAVALRALHDAVRLGDIRAADGIARLAARSTVSSGGSRLSTAGRWSPATAPR